MITTQKGGYSFLPGLSNNKLSKAMCQMAVCAGFVALPVMVEQAKPNHGDKKFYITGEQGIYKVLNYCELADINLTVLLKQNAESTPPTRPSGETWAEKQ